jgi:hypothetical protein
VSGGSEQHANFNLAPVRTFRVSGKVIGSSPLGRDQEIYVMLWNKESREQAGWASLSGAKQSFTMEAILPGDYSLIASAFGSYTDGKRLDLGSAQAAVTITAADVEGQTLLLRPAHNEQLQGKLTIDPAPTSPADLSKLVVTFETDSDERAMFTRAGMVEASTISKSGSFTLTATGATGTLQAHLVANGFGFEDYYTKTVSLGGRDVTESGISSGDLTPGATFELTVSPFGARVDGVVLDDSKKPVANAFVVCVPEPKLRARHELYITDTTNQQGHYVLRGLRPGAYKVYAFDEVDPGAIYSSEFLKPIEDMGESMEVKEKDTLTKPLQVLHQTED